jgi:hypothetical protein
VRHEEDSAAGHQLHEEGRSPEQELDLDDSRALG